MGLIYKYKKRGGYISYHISDSHFNHDKIIEYCNRPFANVTDMNEYIINQWNNIITPHDIVYHHGDFALNTDQDTTRELVNKLNGKIILILGNHDRHGKQWFLDCGFIEVYTKSIVINNYILSHKPINIEQIPDGFVDIHGHIHNYDKGLDKDKYINMSCEVVDYKPVWINTKI